MIKSVGRPPRFAWLLLVLAGLTVTYLASGGRHVERVANLDEDPANWFLEYRTITTRFNYCAVSIRDDLSWIAWYEGEPVASVRSARGIRLIGSGTWSIDGVDLVLAQGKGLHGNPSLHKAQLFLALDGMILRLADGQIQGPSEPVGVGR